MIIVTNMKSFFILILFIIGTVGCNNTQQRVIIEKKTDDSLKQAAVFRTQKLKEQPDDYAPDGSRIYLLSSLNGGSMCLCELPAGETTQSVHHKSVEEIWFFLSGEGEVWRKLENKEEVTVVSKDMSLTIPLGCHFQFRNTGKEMLRFIIVTMPPWPGEDEAIIVKNHWELH